VNTEVRVAYAKRLARAGAEAGYDAIVWVSGLWFAAWITTDVAGSDIGTPRLVGVVLAICLLSVVCGLLAGLYRGRHQPDSLDEMSGAAIAGGLMLIPLVLLSGLLVGRQRELVPTVAGGALIALPAIAVARYVRYAARRHRKRTTEAGVKVIVFGAGDAGTALIGRLLDERGAAYRPVALLDDDPGKRRLRVHGIPVRGNRSRLDEVAAATGATVLVIAIAKPSGTVIRDLTARAELCGLIPRVVPTTSELISGSAQIDGVRDPRIDPRKLQPTMTEGA
jgi:FlaA1/EpsC-like NDP-sugar epimerase